MLFPNNFKKYLGCLAIPKHSQDIPLQERNFPFVTKNSTLGTSFVVLKQVSELLGSLGIPRCSQTIPLPQCNLHSQITFLEYNWEHSYIKSLKCFSKDSEESPKEISTTRIKEYFRNFMGGFHSGSGGGSVGRVKNPRGY